MPGHGIYYGEWVGLKFVWQFLSSPYAYRVIKNTVLLSTYSIIFGFPIPIFFAICISEISHSLAKRTLQTVSYLPHFISTVVLVGIMKNIFAIDNGIVNVVISDLGGDLTKDINVRASTTLQVRYVTIVAATLPILVIYPLLQKYFVKGVMIGAVKG